MPDIGCCYVLHHETWVDQAEYCDEETEPGSDFCSIHEYDWDDDDYYDDDEEWLDEFEKLCEG